jgi:hypothetical protein
MKQNIILILLILATLNIYSQNKMRKVEELINETESGWFIVSEWIQNAKNKVEVLAVNQEKAKEALYKIQVTTRSPMGAIVYKTGGILVDDGWIRILGSGNEKLNRTLPEWNKTKSFIEYGEKTNFLLIADDAIGGFFILNAGKFGKNLGAVFYFAPDTLEYEALEMNYSEFIQFCFNNDLEKFYQNKRWENWKSEVSKLDGNKVFNFYPYLWTKEGKDINKIDRKIIDIGEQYYFNIETRDKLNSKHN